MSVNNSELKSGIGQTRWSQNDLIFIMGRLVESGANLSSKDIPDTIETSAWVSKIEPMLTLSKRKGVETARAWGLEENDEKWSEIVLGTKYRVFVRELADRNLLLFHTHPMGNLPEAVLVSQEDYQVVLSYQNLKGMVNCLGGGRLIGVLKTVSTPAFDNGTETRIRRLYQEIGRKYKQPSPEMVIEIMSEMALQFGLIVYQGELGENLNRIKLVQTIEG